MQDRYLSALRQIEKAEREKISIYEDGMSRFDSLISGIGGQKMTISDYLKIQEMFFARYGRRADRSRDAQEKHRMGQAQMFIILQSQRLMAARTRKRLRRYYPNIIFTAPVNPELYQFVARKRPFYRILVRRIQNRLFILWSGAACICLIFLVLVCQIPFWTGWVLSAALGLYGVYRSCEETAPRLVAQQMIRRRAKLDMLQQNFEKQMSRKTR